MVFAPGSACAIVRKAPMKHGVERGRLGSVSRLCVQPDTLLMTSTSPDPSVGQRCAQKIGTIYRCPSDAPDGPAASASHRSISTPFRLP